MSNISFGGLASGLPTEDLISSFMEMEKAAFYRLQEQKNEEAEKLKAYGSYDKLLDELREAVSNMHSISDIRQTEVEVTGDDAPFSASSNGAASGSHTVAVEQLAQVQKTISDGVSSKDEAIFSEGSITVGDTVIVVDENNNSLEGIMDSINSLSDETGVTASIINDGAESGNFHLVLTGDDASTKFAFGANVTVTEDGQESKFSAEHVSAAQQAIAYIDGVRVVSDTNKITDSVAGLTISLNKASEHLSPEDGAAGAGHIISQVQQDLSVGVDSKDEKIFSRGTISIGDTEIKISKANSSLEGMMKAINAKTDETGVTASIVESDTSGKFHLVLTGKDSLTEFDVKTNLKVTEDGKTYDFTTKPVTEAEHTVLATNTINIEPDTDAAKEKITDFVAAYNATMEWIVSGYEYKPDESSDKDAKADDGDSDKDDDDKDIASASDKDAYYSNLLRGDGSINRVKRDLQSLLSESVGNSSAYNILAEIGIQTQQDGTLHINTEVLDDALENNFEDVVSLMAGDNSNEGIMDKFNTALLEHTSSTKGIYATKQDNYESKTNILDKQMELQESRLDKIEDRYRSQFTALEMTISQLNSQSTFLMNFFASANA